MRNDNTENGPPRIVAVTTGDPFDRLTRSGTNYHLFGALSRTGALTGVVDGSVPFAERLQQLSGWSRDVEVRLQRYDASATPLSPIVRRAMSVAGGRRARQIDSAPDALMQIGTWYDFTRTRGLSPRLRCSFHDGNLATFLGRPDLVIDRTSRHVRRALDYERRVYDSMDLVMPRSEWLRRSFIEDFEQNPAKVVAVGAGANLDRLPDPPQRDHDRPCLLFIGRDFPRKGGPQVLAAFREVRSALPEAELWIVGPREAPAAEAGVRHFGRILRDTQEGEELIDRLYREATAFVMPSLYEPWGIAFLEAMAYGLPCIGGDCCAMPELIADGETGFVVPPGQVEPLAAAMLSLLGDPGRAQSMGDAGRRRFLERYTWDQVAARIVGEISARLDRG